MNDNRGVLFGNKFAVYMAWPFVTSRSGAIVRYTSAMVKEIQRDAAKKVVSEKTILESVYWGLGQLESCPESMLLDIAGTLKEVFYFDSSTEMTVQVGAGQLPRELLKFWKNIGINRINIKIYHPYMLVSPLKTIASFFKNSACELEIYLTAATVAAWKAWARAYLDAPLVHISFGVTGSLSSAGLADWYYWLKDLLESRGFMQYETYRFAIPGFQSRYMQHLGARRPYRGFGVGAATCDGRIQFQNSENMMYYISESENAAYAPVAKSEGAERYTIFLEHLLLGLRSRDGVFLPLLAECLDNEQRNRLQKKIEIFIKHNLLSLCSERVVLTRSGLVHEYEIVKKLSV